MIDKVSHHYADMQVLKDINLHIPSGRIVCVVGPSGCGKSTLLRLCGGLESPDSGQILQSEAAPAECINPLTYVFQDFALLPWRNVQDNISVVLEDHSIGKEQTQLIIDDVLNRTRLTEFRKALPRQLSGGMKQRVAIARALAVKPAILLMDEPLSALDSQTREILLGDLVDLWQREPFTAIYVTHNLSEAVRIGHSVVILSRRPGAIVNIVNIPGELQDRHEGDSELAHYQQTLWSLMKEEAMAADQELLNV